MSDVNGNTPQNNQVPQYNQTPNGQYSQNNQNQQYAQNQYAQNQYNQQYAQNQYNQQYAQNQYAQQPYAAQPPYPQYVVGTHNKIVAGLLGIFLGSLGIHNFYLGYTGKAVAQLVLTLCFWWVVGLGPIAAGIWSFVEAILILVSKPGTQWHRDAQGYELQD